ncbi:type II and III secretion system protein family protein [Fundidesulfovibrio agrisoli]|uniref:type II and III secretion system protein family protein n=1 Tax=Fundidesulfovibrio agrisoli TaxID=2922717 RepID=UPI001FAB7255|nr:type II and III secretion system protein family protein [Fundidesulfovibrio agrisoli]
MQRTHSRFLMLAAFLFIAGLGVCPELYGAEAKGLGAHRIRVTTGKSTIVRCPAEIARVSVADPNVADYVLIPPNQLYVAAKATGVTTLTLWDANNQVRGLYDVEVSPDIQRLKMLIAEVLPDEPGIEVRSANDAIALSGTVKNELNVQRVMTIAQAHGKVLNLMQVGGVQQVMLEVRVAEMQRALIKRLGININALSQGDFIYTFLGALTNLPALANVISNTGTPVNDPTRFFGNVPLTIDQKVQGIFNVNTTINNRPVTWTGFIDILKDNGLAKILAEPTLVCLNGQTADFLAGGEIPVPIPQALGTVTIEWKKFGVELSFTPHVLSGDKISMKVQPSVSDLDYTRSIQIGAFQIPSILKRSTSTVVELGDGQSFAIAGMLREDARDASKKFPALGDVPVLGGLFKSSEYQKNQTELVIVVTPRLAKPVDAKNIKLPTDHFPKEPDDLEFYLGIDKNKLKKNPQPAQNGPVGVTKDSLEGEFGQSVAPPPSYSPASTPSGTGTTTNTTKQGG